MTNAENITLFTRAAKLAAESHRNVDDNELANLIEAGAEAIGSRDVGDVSRAIRELSGQALAEHMYAIDASDVPLDLAKNALIDVLNNMNGIISKADDTVAAGPGGVF